MCRNWLGRKKAGRLWREFADNWFLSGADSQSTWLGSRAKRPGNGQMALVIAFGHLVTLSDARLPLPSEENLKDAPRAEMRGNGSAASRRRGRTRGNSSAFAIERG